MRASGEISMPRVTLVLAATDDEIHLAPCASRFPGFGFWEMTSPFFTVREAEGLTVPSRQPCEVSERFAAARVLPFSFGTTHGGAAVVNVPIAPIAMPPAFVATRRNLYVVFGVSPESAAETATSVVPWPGH